ncbi:MAG: DUF1153 domain-containing protein [Paracoccaceae bacterium]
MFVLRRKGPAFVELPDGSILSRSDLPERGTTRWVARRKAQVVLAVASGLLAIEEACKLYDLSPEELESWKKALASHGLGALRVTKTQKYRQL